MTDIPHNFASFDQHKMYSTFHFANPTTVLGVSEAGIVNPATAPVDPLYVMLQSINDKLSNFQTDLNTLKDSQVSMDSEIQGIKYEQEDHMDMLVD